MYLLRSKVRTTCRQRVFPESLITLISLMNSQTKLLPRSIHWTRTVTITCRRFAHRKELENEKRPNTRDLLGVNPPENLNPERASVRIWLRWRGAVSPSPSFLTFSSPWSIYPIVADLSFGCISEFYYHRFPSSDARLDSAEFLPKVHLPQPYLPEDPIQDPLCYTDHPGNHCYSLYR